MMASELSSITLYFDESEADLWQGLQRIEPENRSAFVKATLRQVLLGENGEEEICEEITPPDTTTKNNEYVQTINQVDTLKSEEYGVPLPLVEVGVSPFDEIQTFSLEALFTGASEPDAEYEGFADPEQTMPNSKEPWDYLLNSVIGEEKDLVVINAILQAAHSSENQDEQSDDIPNKINRSELQVDFESLKVDSPVPSTGFEYMMKHIIGTEEDEVVLKFLRGHSEV